MIHHVWKWIMRKPYSLDIRERFVDYVVQGHSAHSNHFSFNSGAGWLACVCKYIPCSATCVNSSAKRDGVHPGLY